MKVLMWIERGLCLLGTLGLLALLVAGCSFKTVITEPGGREYTVLSQKDAIVHAKFVNSAEITVDNRGSKSSFQSIVDAWLLKYMTETEVKE